MSDTGHDWITSSVSCTDDEALGLIRAAVDHLDHLLPGQAPLLMFVHHNTLHGYQCHPFHEALSRYQALTGIRAYLPDNLFRHFFQTGRILLRDLLAELAHHPSLAAEEILLERDVLCISRSDLYTIALLYGLDPLTSSELTWQIEENGVLDQFQSDVPTEARHRYLNSCRSNLPGAAREECRSIQNLWQACLGVLQLEYHPLNPEALTDLASYPVEHLLHPDEYDACTLDTRPLIHQRMLAEAGGLLESIWLELETHLTLRTLILKLTGEDILEVVRPELIRFAASHLDEHVSAWRNPDRHHGLYAFWRDLVMADPSLLPGDHAEIQSFTLPAQSVEAVHQELVLLGLSQNHWSGYLHRLALELPGWAGLINWRHQRPQYPANQLAPTDLMDFLAIRLVLDRLTFTAQCRRIGAIPPTVEGLRTFFDRHRSEFYVRLSLHQHKLPEYLAVLAQRAESGLWPTVADMIYTWQRSPASERPGKHSPHRDAWRLFRLAQHLGLTACDVELLPAATATRFLETLDMLSTNIRGAIWLAAYERRYRDELLNALARNREREPLSHSDSRPAAHIIFCMDDREESIRRHLEEINPDIETLGAPGFFGIAMNWRGLEDSISTPLCPVTVKPTHTVEEHPTTNEAMDQPQLNLYALRQRMRRSLAVLLNHQTRSNPLLVGIVSLLAAPFMLFGLTGQLFFPAHTIKPQSSAPSTRVRIDDFSDAEQADSVLNLLLDMGLSSQLGHLVVLMGHGSTSENNPHRAAYACGACGGRHGGPNARVFAAMANRREVRQILHTRGFHIPDECWFIGAEHNTCTETISWYDLDDLPSRFRPYFNLLNNDLDQASQRSAHERCRRFAQAPREPTPSQARTHVLGRSVDSSQTRPELGHATHAAAIIGRRSSSRGLFLDRRTFLISYDATQDESGSRLEGILVAAGPVAAGINLEYYFSTVDADLCGCGSKMTHNVLGGFGILEGSQSDLRTGLPRQMTEIHEPMRLLIVVEHRTGVLTDILSRQPALSELVNNAWVQLASLDPITSDIAVYIPGTGFEPWTDINSPLPDVPHSAAWYSGHSALLGPALIQAQTHSAH